MKYISFISIMFSVLSCITIQSHSSTIAVFDPFSTYFEQFKKELSSFSNEKIVKIYSLSDSILSFSTLFLFLAEGANQKSSISFQEYTLAKQEHELLIQYLMKDKNLHIYAQPFYSGPVPNENPTLFSYLKISYAGAVLISLGVDSAIGGGTALFRENIEKFQIIRKDSSLEGIWWPDSPFIEAEKKTVILSGCSYFGCDKTRSELSYLFYPEHGKVIIDLFYFLDYKPYLKTLCKFYDIPVGIKDDGLFKNSKKTQASKPAIILNKHTHINLASLYDKPFDEVFLTDLNGQRYFHYTGYKLVSKKINISKLPPSFYLLVFRKKSSTLNTERLLIVNR